MDLGNGPLLQIQFVEVKLGLNVEFGADAGVIPGPARRLSRILNLTRWRSHLRVTTTRIFRSQGGNSHRSIAQF